MYTHRKHRHTGHSLENKWPFESINMSPVNPQRTFSFLDHAIETSQHWDLTHTHTHTHTHGAWTRPADRENSLSDILSQCVITKSSNYCSLPFSHKCFSFLFCIIKIFTLKSTIAHTSALLKVSSTAMHSGSHVHWRTWIWVLNPNCPLKEFDRPLIRNSLTLTYFCVGVCVCGWGGCASHPALCVAVREWFHLCMTRLLMNSGSGPCTSCRTERAKSSKLSLTGTASSTSTHQSLRGRGHRNALFISALSTTHSISH